MICVLWLHLNGPGLPPVACHHLYVTRHTACPFLADSLQQLLYGYQSAIQPVGQSVGHVAHHWSLMMMPSGWLCWVGGHPSVEVWRIPGMLGRCTVNWLVHAPTDISFGALIKAVAKTRCCGRRLAGLVILCIPLAESHQVLADATPPPLELAAAGSG